MPALLLVDIQNDFLPGGALAVTHGDEVVAVANELMPEYDLVIATQDWHPADHQSFAAQHPGKQVGDMIQLQGLPQILWPVHCVQDTPGAQLHPGLPGELVDVIMDKGLDPHSQGYSAFQDTGLAKLLRADRVQHLVVVGLATDYCVRNSVLDALREGFDVTVVRSGVRAVDLTPGDGERALQEMHAAGARLVADAADLVGDA